MKKATTILALLLLASAFLSGCASNVLPLHQVDSHTLRMAEVDMYHHRLPPPRMIPNEKMEGVLLRVWKRMRPAGYEACLETFTHGCEASINSMRLMVVHGEGCLNALEQDPPFASLSIHPSNAKRYAHWGIAPRKAMSMLTSTM